MKTCTKCNLEKPVEEFALRGKSGSGQRKSECKLCGAARQKVYEAAQDPEERRHRRRQRTHGITETREEIAAMAVRQRHCCAICGRHESESHNGLHLDHSHRSGETRGLLCQKCNVGLGMFEDNADVLRVAAFYLEGRAA